MSLDIAKAPSVSGYARFSSLTHALASGCAHDRVQVVVVRTAAAEVAGQRVPDLVARRRRVLVEQRDGRHDLARRAEPALWAELIDHRLLDLVQLAVRAFEALDRRDRAAAYGVRQRRARIVRDAVDEHRAGAALAAVAAEL